MKNNKKSLLITIIITFAMTCIFLASNKIYPFGKNIFAVQDFDHAYIPIYYKLWDVLHGHSSILFDWNLGVGLNCFGSLIGNSLLSPTSWIIAIFKRSFIPYAMSFIIIIKILEVSIITYLVLNKMFKKVDKSYLVIFTLTYTFCGWTAFMISSILYLDVFALFPLFVLSFYRLLKDNKWGLYVIVLTICLILSYYMSYLIIFFIIGTTVIGTLILDIKDKKKKVVEVLLLTLISLGLSCIVFLPAFYQAKTSTRMAAAASFDNSFNLSETLLKVIYMLPMALPFYYTFKQLMVKKDKKNNIFFIFLLIYLLIGIIVPQINAMWHTGSYSGLPFRYSFIPSFVLILISLYYLENNNKEDRKEKKSIIYYLLSVICLVLLIVLALVYRKEYINSDFVFGINNFSQFACLLILFLIALVSINVITKSKSKILLTVFSIIYLSIFTLYFIRVYTNDQLSLKTQDIKDNLKLPNDGYNYLYDIRDISINSPYILQVPSMQNGIHFIKKEMVDFSNNLGYEKFDTYTYAHGGNIFTNLIKNNKYVLTYNKMDKDLYKEIDSYQNLKLYSSNYNLGLLIPYNGKYYNNDAGNMAINTNNIYKTIFNQKDDIMHIINSKIIKLTTDNIYYFESVTSDFNKIIKQLEKDDYSFDLATNDNFTTMNLQVDKNTTISIEPKEYIVSYISKKEFTNFVNNNHYETKYTEKKNTRTYIFNNTNNYKKVLIPINYDNSYTVKVNNKDVKYEANVYNLVSIPIEKGQNKIEIKYLPKLLKEGIIISIITLLTLLFFIFTNKKLNI